MTDTTFERQFIDGLADTVSNQVLEQVLYDNFHELGVPEYTAKEHAFADALATTYPGSDAVPGIAARYEEAAKEQVKELRARNGHAIQMWGMLAG